ncbi:hypothetical protein CBS101457_003825 [Exobasidium rhododendri]|nr:hypothetical protein CBS101457_003825 [Exobasidium rhododendri]
MSVSVALLRCHAIPIEAPSPHSTQHLTTQDMDLKRAATENDNSVALAISFPGPGLDVEEEETILTRRAPARLGTHIKARWSGMKAAHRVAKLHRQKLLNIKWGSIAARKQYEDGKISLARYQKLVRSYALDAEIAKGSIRWARLDARERVYAQARRRKRFGQG